MGEGPAYAPADGATLERSRAALAPARAEAIAGVHTKRLRLHRDDRGAVTELFRCEWGVGLDPVQWTFLASRGGVLRGMHVHPRHVDYVVVQHGRCRVALADLRAGSSSEGATALVELRADEPCGLTIPNGVLHGFFFPQPSLMLLGASHAYEPSDELGCRWDDPELGIRWPVRTPCISARDAGLGSLRALRVQLGARRA